MKTDPITQLLPPVDNPNDNQDFMSVLKRSFPAWDFFTSTKQRDGEVNVLNYYACQPWTQCGIQEDNQKVNGFQTNFPLTGIAGAFLDLRYSPPGFDYSNAIASNVSLTNLHWIQRVVASNGSCKDAQDKNCKDPIDKIDILSNQSDPFYDTNAAARNYFFIDLPRRKYDKSTNWQAELYLAEEIINPASSKRSVVIYDGIKWGWNSKVTPVITKKGTIIDNEFNEFAIADLPPSVPFVAWIDNLTGAGEPRSLEMSLAAVDPKTGDRVIDYSDGENLFDDVWGTGISSLVGKDGKIKLKVSSSSSFTGDYTLYVKVGEKNFSFLSSQSSNSANSALAAQAMFASDNFYSATIPGENGTLFSISSADTQSVPEPGTIVGLAGIGILGFLSRKKKKP